MSDRYERLSERFSARVEEVALDRWSSPSPCPGWTARDVVRHVVDAHGLLLGLVGRSVEAAVTVDEAPAVAWGAARAAVLAELVDRDRASATFEGFEGTTRLDDAVDRSLSFDLVIHGWDLARAAGLDARIPLADVVWATEQARSFGPTLQSSGLCAPPVHLRPGADAQTRLLALVGRQA